MTSYQAPSKSTVEDSDSTSEPGLAEWTSKIKAMQRQVDADDEVEQMRLEQEIAASRLARKRRSQGFGYAGRTNSDVSRVDMEQSDSFVTSKNSSEPEVRQAPKGIGSPSSAASPSGLARGLKKSTSSIDKPQPMSLAAFMGGNATGPRLRKHAPQQDAHDPTQFDQRAFDRTPHPAFGTGGVALPGIAVHRDGGTKPSAIAALAKTTPTSASSEASLASRTNSETYRRQSPITRIMDAQERAPSLPSSSPSNLQSLTSPTSYNQKRKCESTQLPTLTHQTPRAYNINPLPSRSTPVVPAKQSRLPTDETPSPSRSLYTAPPLAGPIRPQPRPSTSGPQIPLSVAPSKAFTRQPVQKELTPSLSRLQGRGFVQKLSSRLESPPTVIPETSEKNTPANGRRTSSVLDRWQPNASQTTPSPAPRMVRRSTTFGPAKDNSSQPLSSDHEGRSLRGTISQPSLRQEDIPTRPSSSSSKTHGEETLTAVGLGSATTLVVYKPEPVETPSIDEFGVKPNRFSRGAISDFPAPSKPLSHPTKDRARKPQKRTASGAPTNSAKNVISSVDVPSVLTRASVTSGDSQATSFPPTGGISIVPPSQPEETRSSQGRDNMNLSLKMGTFELRQSLSDLLDSRPVSTITPGIKSEAQSGDTPRLVRRALPGLSAPQAEGKPSSSQTPVSHARNPETTGRGSTRRALPGLLPLNDKDLCSQSPVLKKEGSVSMAPTAAKPPQMLNGGDRPIIMDVARNSHDSRHAQQAPNEPLQSASSIQSRSPRHTKERRSSSERYSPVAPLPLEDEAMSSPTLTGTLSRKDTDSKRRNTRQGEEKVQSISETSGVLSLAISQVPVNNAPSIQVSSLTHVNFDYLLKYNSRHHHDPGTKTISVEVMSITGATASLLTRDQTIFYDTELLVIVHRSTPQSSGMVSTSVWGWEGRRAILGAREQRKVQEIAQRYGTSAIVVQQNSEPSQLVHILGGVLAIRQGSRTRWTPENTAMHLVRSLDGVVYVDEKDLSIKNLCSGYSYCISILDSVYVWSGRGSTPLEKKAALEYGRSLATTSPPIELTEDNSKDDEIFWTILGEDEYANADYWKWRRNSSRIDPRIWRVRADLVDDCDCVAVVNCLSCETCLHNSVYIIDCVWEFYVVVGSDARGHKQDIELAINVATELSTRISSTRPYAPTVHTLILPSQLPRDLRMMFRDLDEFSVNKGEIPDHMNLLSSNEAYRHLVTTNWDEYALRDPTLLPLGIDASY